MTTFDVQGVREHFPALKQPQVFLDNAGGSQILGDVADSYVCSYAVIIWNWHRELSFAISNALL